MGAGRDSRYTRESMLSLALSIAVATVHIPAHEQPGARCLLLAPEPAPLLGDLELWQAPLLFAWDWRPPSMRVVSRSEPPAPDEIIAKAREFLGTPYAWGGLGEEGGYDCSGFVNKVYAENGYDLPRTSREQYFVGAPVARGSLSMADLLFFVSKPGDTRISHVAMYINDSEFIHAAMGKGEVTFDRLSSRYYDARFFGARRILTLRPGRYSNMDGSARVKDRGGAASDGEPTVVLGGTGVSGGGRSDGDEQANAILQAMGQGEGGPPHLVLTEHAADDRPATLASSIIKGAITHVGPYLQRSENTALGVRVGAGGMNGTATAALAPEVTYFDPDTSMFVALAAPFRTSLAKGGPTAGELIQQDWRTARDFSRVVQELRYGQKESELYLELGRNASGTLGHGQIMRYYTPNVTSRSVPDFVIAPDALSLAFDGVLGSAGGETFVDDVVAPRVLGALAYARPGALLGAESLPLRTLSTGLTYAVDVAAPYALQPSGRYSERAVHALGFDVESKVGAWQHSDLKTYVDVSSLLHSNGTGFGSALGVLWRANLVGSRTHVLRLRAEAKLAGPGFMASYFDTTYRLNRAQAPVDQVGPTPLTKQQLLDEMQRGPSRYGFFGEVVYQMQRRVNLGLGYEDGGAFGTQPATSRYVGRSLATFVRINDLYLPGSSRSLDLYIAYHLRNFEKVFPLLTSARPNEYLFVSVALRATRYVSVGASLRKGFDPTYTQPAVDGMLDLAVAYEL